MRPFRAADALSHRRLGDQERVRDLRGGQPADRAEREGELRRRRRARDDNTGTGARACRPGRTARPGRGRRARPRDSSRRRRALSLLQRVDQAPRRRPARSQGRRIVGNAASGPLLAAASSASCTASSRRVELPAPAARACRGPAARARAAGPRRGEPGSARPVTSAGIPRTCPRVARRRRRPAPGSRCRSSASGASPAWRAASDQGRVAEQFRSARSGMICQDRPKRSLSQPHWLSSPPSVSAFQK